MEHKTQQMRVRVDGYTRLCLTAIAILLTVIVIGLWAEGVRSADQIHAAEPFLNSSSQRKDMIKAQEQTNAKLDQIIKLLQDGRVKVQIVSENAKTKKVDHKPVPRKGS